jgi:CRP/FNR family transcriptional regulator
VRPGAASAAADDPATLQLEGCALLAPLPRPVLASLASQAVRRTYVPGQALFRRGEPAEQLWVICSGRVQASTRSTDGREFVAHVAGPGETPGHNDLIDLHPRTSDAYAVDEVETLVLPASAVRRALLDHPHALMQLAADLAGIVRVLGELAADGALLDLRSRVGKLLLSSAPPGQPVDFGVSQAALAGRFGVARQSLNRVLAELQRRRLIRIEEGGRRLTVIDPIGLRRLVVGDRG